jgi:hypothetical protein
MPRQSKDVSGHQDNAVARSAMEAVKQIEHEAREKKLAQADALTTAKAAIENRIGELQHQLAQVNAAIATISGTPTPQEQRGRRDWSTCRQHVIQWMEERKGQKFAAGDIVRKFPQLEGTPISTFLKPLLQNGKINTDTSEGIKRPKYFVAA